MSYWDRHGIVYLFFLTFFPRIALLFSSATLGGLLWWVGWIFSPRLLVAVLATLVYWQANPILVILSWLVALGGESSEKYFVVRRSRMTRTGGSGYESAKWVKAEVLDRDP